MQPIFDRRHLSKKFARGDMTEHDRLRSDQPGDLNLADGDAQDMLAEIPFTKQNVALLELPGRGHEQLSSLRASTETHSPAGGMPRLGLWLKLYSGAQLVGYAMLLMQFLLSGRFRAVT
jgi:hypothetical protein